MCCDLWAFDLTSHTCLLLAEACFKSVTSVFSLSQFGVTPILDSPTKDKDIYFYFYFIPRLIGLFAWQPLTLLIERWQPSRDSQLHCTFLEKYGVATENMPFFIFLLLVTRYA